MMAPESGLTFRRNITNKRAANRNIAVFKYLFVCGGVAIYDGSSAVWWLQKTRDRRFRSFPRCSLHRKQSLASQTRHGSGQGTFLEASAQTGSDLFPFNSLFKLSWNNTIYEMSRVPVGGNVVAFHSNFPSIDLASSCVVNFPSHTDIDTRGEIKHFLPQGS